MKVDIPAVISMLEGSCLSLGVALDAQGAEEEDMTAEDCAVLDQAIMNCDRCGWWYETGEMNTDGGDTLCGDCAEAAAKEGAGGRA